MVTVFQRTSRARVAGSKHQRRKGIQTPGQYCAPWRLVSDSNQHAMNAEFNLIVRRLVLLIAALGSCSAVLGAEPNPATPPNDGTPPGSALDVAKEQAARELLREKI